eukprot:scaffold1722_cov380-Prasinococcus_capsulatus_cf.AAC.7
MVVSSLHSLKRSRVLNRCCLRGCPQGLAHCAHRASAGSGAAHPGGGGLSEPQPKPVLATTVRASTLSRSPTR